MNAISFDVCGEAAKLSFRVFHADLVKVHKAVTIILQETDRYWEDYAWLQQVEADLRSDVEGLGECLERNYLPKFKRFRKIESHLHLPPLLFCGVHHVWTDMLFWYVSSMLDTVKELAAYSEKEYTAAGRIRIFDPTATVRKCALPKAEYPVCANPGQVSEEEELLFP